MKKQLIVSTLALAILGLVAYGATRAYADNQWGGHTTIIEKLVERFGLNEEDVKAVFDETRKEHQVEMQSRLEERLNKAVASGDLTESQKQAIIAKHEEMKVNREANHESFQGMTREERKEAMEVKKAEMESWAEENSIDLKDFFVGSKFGNGHGLKRGF